MAKKDKKKGAKSAMSEEEKLAKKKARIEAMKSRPAVQRPNSKQIDVIGEIDEKTGEVKGAHVKNFGYPVRKSGSIITSVVYDEDGNPISSSVVFIPGVKVKTKKNHGVVQPGVAGEGKKGKDDDADDIDDEDSEEQEEKLSKKGKKKKKED